MVWPAAGFPLAAKRNGAQLVIINREATEFDDIADLVVHDDIGAMLVAVHRALIRHRAAYAQARHTRIAQAHLFLFHEGANVIFIEQIRRSVQQETTIQAAACGVMASDDIPKRTGT